MLEGLAKLSETCAEFKEITDVLVAAVDTLDQGGEVDVAEALHTVKVKEKAINRRLIVANRSLEKAYPVQLSISDLKKIAPVSPAAQNQDPEGLLDYAVFVHMLQTGAMGAATRLLESQPRSEKNEQLYKSVKEGQAVMDALREKDLTTVSDWISKAEPQLDELTLRNLRFDFDRYHILLQFLSTGDVHYAISLTRQRLPQYSDLRLDDIAELTTALTLWNSSTSDPSVTLGVPVLEKSLQSLTTGLRQAVLRSMKLAPVSPLVTAYLASVDCLPAYAKTTVLLQTGAAEWTTKSELPMEVTLPRDLQFHPIFVCPVSKEETSAANPPVVLPCGHVLSESSAADLVEYSHLVMDTKCPYCLRVFGQSPPRVTFM